MGRLTLPAARQRLRRKRVTPTTWQQQNRQVTEAGKPMASRLSSLSSPQKPALVQAAPADGTSRCPSLHQPPLHRARRHPEQRLLTRNSTLSVIANYILPIKLLFGIIFLVFNP